MRSTPRSAAVLLGLLPAALAGQRTQPAQRGGPAGPDTRRVLIATFASTDRQLGVEASNALRERAQDQYSIKRLWVVTKPEMDRTLTSSGFAADSALAMTDVMELGRTVRADYIVDGVARKTADGVVVEPRLQLRRGENVLTQPLSAISAKNMGDVTKIVLKSLDEVLNAMPSYLACEAELRAGRYDAAASNARATIAAYAGSTFGRLCLLTAFNLGKAPADSILRVANEILATDSLSMIALSNAFDASMARGDTAGAVRYGTRAWRINRSNRPLLVAVVNGLVSLGRLDDALGLIKEALDVSPDDAGLVKTRMQLLLRLKRYKEGIAAGDSLARLDPAAVTPEFINRMAAAAALDSQPEIAANVYERGVALFPSDAELHLSYAQALAKTGKLAEALGAAQRAVTLKPAVENGYLFVLSYQLQLSQFDSALATAPRAIAAGAAKEKIADALVAAILPGVAKAQKSTLRDDWQAVLAVAQRVDKIAPSQGSKFYIGVSAYNIGAGAVTAIDALNTQLKGARPAAQKELRSKACAEAKIAEDNFATASISIASGGGFDRDTAAKLMQGLQQSGDFVSQAKGLFCK